MREVVQRKAFGCPSKGRGGSGAGRADPGDPASKCKPYAGIHVDAYSTGLWLSGPSTSKHQLMVGVQTSESDTQYFGPFVEGD